MDSRPIPDPSASISGLLEPDTAVAVVASGRTTLLGRAPGPALADISDN